MIACARGLNMKKIIFSIAILLITLTTICYSQIVLNKGVFKGLTMTTTVFSGAQVVPGNFLGIHFNLYPVDFKNVLNPIPAPTYNYSLYRTFGYAGAAQYFASLWSGLQNGYNSFTGPTSEGGVTSANDFAFTVTGVTNIPPPLSTYTNNGQTFTIHYANISGTSGIIYAGSSSGNPSTSGTLTFAAGFGQTTISFSSWNKVYQFFVSGITTQPSVGSTYTNNGNVYTTLYSAAGNGSGTVFSTGSASPLTTGTLVQTSGTGDATISYSAWGFQDGYYVDQAWGYLDQQMVLQYNGSGTPRQIIFTAWGTPYFATSNQSVASPEGGGFGAGYPPTDVTTSTPNNNIFLTQFVNQVLNRYNLTSAGNPNGYKMITYLEEWNEPQYTTNSYFAGTPSQLATMAKAIWNAVHTFNVNNGQTIKTISPGFTPGGATNPYVFYLDQFLTATVSDGSGDGTTGVNWVDAVCIHPYGQIIPNFTVAQASSATPSTAIANVQTELTAVGLPTSFPIYSTEQGISGNASDPIFTELSDLQKAEYVFQASIYQIIAGYQFAAWFSHDSVYSGMPSSSVNVSNALNLITSIEGKTIVLVQTVGTFMKVTCSDGTVVKF